MARIIFGGKLQNLLSAKLSHAFKKKKFAPSFHFFSLSVFAYRAMAVLEPLKVKITNLPPDMPRNVRVPNFPAREDKGFHEVPLSDVVYIEQSDFREVCSSVL